MLSELYDKNWSDDYDLCETVVFASESQQCT